jgi:hypothetical protein
MMLDIFDAENALSGRGIVHVELDAVPTAVLKKEMIDVEAFATLETLGGVQPEAVGEIGDFLVHKPFHQGFPRVRKGQISEVGFGGVAQVDEECHFEILSWVGGS